MQAFIIFFKNCITLFPNRNVFLTSLYTSSASNSNDKMSDPRHKFCSLIPLTSVGVT